MTRYGDEVLEEAPFRQAAAERLRRMPGLAYASMTDDPLGPMLVTYQGEPVGEIHKSAPGAVQNWHAQAYNADGELGQVTGPFLTARLAADSLIREGGEL